MIMNRSRYFLVLLAFILTAFSGRVPQKIRVWMIGDSTMCDYPAARAPLAGWGMPFRVFFDSTVQVENHARGGRSTRTFISEGRWTTVLNGLSEGDYLLVQFGHNDEAKEEKYKDRYTPVPDYKTNLARFITEARAKKALPILITPVSRMRFEKEQAMETHAEYTAACFEIGKQYNVPVIDLDGKSRALYQQLGPERTKRLFMQLAPGAHPHYPEGQKDNTHFNDYGARRIAELVLEGLREQKIGLAERVVKPIVKK